MPFNNSEYRRDYLERRRASRYTLGLPQSATEQFREALATASPEKQVKVRRTIPPAPAPKPQPRPKTKLKVPRSRFALPPRPRKLRAALSYAERHQTKRLIYPSPGWDLPDEVSKPAPAAKGRSPQTEAEYQREAEAKVIREWVLGHLDGTPFAKPSFCIPDVLAVIPAEISLSPQRMAGVIRSCLKKTGRFDVTRIGNPESYRTIYRPKGCPAPTEPVQVSPASGPRRARPVRSAPRATPHTGPRTIAVHRLQNQVADERRPR
jgi:hypothetical protein